MLVDLFRLRDRVSAGRAGGGGQGGPRRAPPASQGAGTAGGAWRRGGIVDWKEGRGGDVRGGRGAHRGLGDHGLMGSWRKAYGALKDSTRVGLAKVNSDFKVSRGDGDAERSRSGSI